MTLIPAPSCHLDSINVEGSTNVPVLCLHGLFAGSWVYERLLPRIAERGFPASALSYRGHPPAEPSREMGRHSIVDYCHDASEAARALNRPIVIGHSLGGLIALLLAGRNLIRAAVLVSPAPPRGISVLSPAILWRMIPYVPAMLFNRPFLPSDRHLDALVLNRVPEGSRSALRRRFVAGSGRVSRETALGLFKVPARAVRAPLLVVGAEHDRFIPLETASRVARAYAASWHVARGHGHFLFSEPGWEDTADVILEWIQALPRVLRDTTAEVGVRPLRTNSTLA